MGGIAVSELVVPCGLEKRKLGLGKLGAVRHVEMLAFVSKGHLRASEAAEPVEFEEMWGHSIRAHSHYALGG